jgi:hypothetical protein
VAVLRRLHALDVVAFEMHHLGDRKPPAARSPLAFSIVLSHRSNERCFTTVFRPRLK